MWSIVARYGLIGLSPSNAISESLRIASTPSRPSSARRYATVPSMVLPSSSVPVICARSAAAAQRSVAPGSPINANISAPCTAIPGYRSTSPYSSNHCIQRNTVVALPLAHTRLALVSVRRHAIRVAGRLGVLERRLRHAVRLAPLGGPQVESRDDLRFAPPQLGRQQLAEQVVVAVPLAAAVEWHHEQVAGLELLEHATRSRLTQRGVAERSGHRVEDRRVRQERRLGRQDPIEDLGA